MIIIDDAATATRERFPHAKEIHNGSFAEEFGRLEVRPLGLISIVHGEMDRELSALRSRMRRKPVYIGLLGSRRKAAEVRKRLMVEGFSQEEVQAISAPIGLDVGAVTPEEVAVSIVAELIGVYRGRPRGTS